MENYKKYRRELHQIPEICFTEYKTSEYIKAHLSNIPCKVESVVETGVLAFFDNKKDFTLAFRADMDALAIEEQNEVDFISKHKGVMHACGHDGHMAMLLALADYLKESYQNYNFNILLIFQPAEESMGGAKKIVESGALKRYGVKHVFGLHVWPMLPVGTVSTRAGALMAKAREVNIIVNGESAHCATPENGVDALKILCHILCDAYKMHKEEIDPDITSLLHFGVAKAGDVRNILAQKAIAEGTIRAFDDETYDFIVRRLTEICKQYDEKHGSKTEIVFGADVYPVVYNEQNLFEEYKEALQVGGIPFSEYPEPHKTAEDFSYYQKEVPSIFAFLGVGAVPSLHNAKFNFDEKALKTGVDVYISLLEYYKNKSLMENKRGIR